MAEFDYIPIVLAAALSAIVSFILLGVKKLGATSEGTLSGTIRLEHVSAGMKELEERINKNFEKIEKLIGQREAESSESLHSIYEKINTIEKVVALNTWRLDKLEGNGSSKVGKGAV